MKNSYPVLTTDAFVLHTRGVGEADRIITVLTRDSGLMNVHARSIRKEGAKMRGVAVPYGRVSLSVVLGKRTILKDMFVTDIFDAIWCDEAKYTAFIILLYHIRAFIPVIESHDEDFFVITETAVHFLKHSTSSYSTNILLVAQVMLLTALGYIPDQTILPAHFADILKDVSSSSDRHKEFRQYLQNALQYQ